MIGKWNRRLICALLVVSLGMGGAPKMIMACSQCFGTNVNNATTFGITMSMLGLLGFLGIVWGGIGLFIWRVQRRSKILEPDDLVVTENGELVPRDN